MQIINGLFTSPTKEDSFLCAPAPALKLFALTRVLSKLWCHQASQPSIMWPHSTCNVCHAATEPRTCKLPARIGFEYRGSHLSKLSKPHLVIYDHWLWSTFNHDMHNNHFSFCSVIYMPDHCLIVPNNMQSCKMGTEWKSNISLQSRWIIVAWYAWQLRSSVSSGRPQKKNARKAKFYLYSGIQVPLGWHFAILRMNPQACVPGLPLPNNGYW